MPAHTDELYSLVYRLEERLGNLEERVNALLERQQEDSLRFIECIDAVRDALLEYTE